MKTLLIGIGNTLREDDAAGPETVRRFRRGRPDTPDLETLTVTQLLPEHSARFAEAERVIAVDCAVSEDVETEVQVTRVTASGEAASGMDHTLSLEGLLGLCERVYGRVPETWLVTLPGTQFGYAEEVSAEMKAIVDEAVRQLERLSYPPGSQLS